MVNVTEIRSMGNAKPWSCAGKDGKPQHQEKGDGVDNRIFEKVEAHASPLKRQKLCPSRMRIRIRSGCLEFPDMSYQKNRDF